MAKIDFKKSEIPFKDYNKLKYHRVELEDIKLAMPRKKGSKNL